MLRAYMVDNKMLDIRALDYNSYDPLNGTFKVPQVAGPDYEYPQVCYSWHICLTLDEAKEMLIKLINKEINDLARQMEYYQDRKTKVLLLKEHQL